VTTNYETREHDVLIIGAGGAGLRAAIEALAQGASVGVVCKSLLRKSSHRHAEGGDRRSDGQRRCRRQLEDAFSRTMRGGKFLNNWRMAQLHAQESPDRVRELEQWAPFSTARKAATFCNGLSAATPLSASATLATALASK